MKLNDWLILISSSAYFYLFYEQSAGINFFLFSMLLVCMCFFRNRQLFSNPAWLTVAAGTMVSGFAVFYYGDGLAVFANVVSLFLLAAFSFNTNTSLFISFGNAVFSAISAFVFMILRLTDTANSAEGARSGYLRKFVLLVLALLVTGVFFVLYRESNPLFEETTNKIDLSILSFEWLPFLVMGTILMYGFFYHRFITWVNDFDERSSDLLDYVSEEDHQKSFFASFIPLPNESFTAMALFALLNLLLLSVNGIDIYYLYIIERLPDSLTLSEYLHDGTEALILSIILAVGIILFVFRGRLNFDDSSKITRSLTYAWLAQNIFLIITTANRNFFYVSNFGFTHKRLGVYVFLALCIIGLVITFIKVFSVRSSWFIYRKNSWVWYCTLVIATVINWDAFIANHNLKLAVKKNAEVDANYLNELSYTALLTLFEHYETEKAGTGPKVFNQHLVSQMLAKYSGIANEVETAAWQSGCLLKIKTKKRVDEIMANDKLSVVVTP